MKPTELRIGNWVCLYDTNDESVELQVTPKLIIGLSEKQTGDYQINVKPIPLTEEWLKKFGFKINTTPNRWYMPKETAKFSWDVTEVNDGNFLIEKIGIYGNDVAFQYVHQFQNLYFALTNTELTIK